MILSNSYGSETCKIRYSEYDNGARRTSRATRLDQLLSVYVKPAKVRLWRCPSAAPNASSAGPWPREWRYVKTNGADRPKEASWCVAVGGNGLPPHVGRSYVVGVMALPLVLCFLFILLFYDWLIVDCCRYRTREVFIYFVLFYWGRLPKATPAITWYWCDSLYEGHDVIAVVLLCEWEHRLTTWEIGSVTLNIPVFIS